MCSCDALWVPRNLSLFRSPPSIKCVSFNMKRKQTRPLGCYIAGMFQFGSAAKSSPEFVPDDDSRDWIAGEIVELAPLLGEAGRKPHLLTDPENLSVATPHDLDSLFDMVCAVQEVVGQAEVELTIVEVDGGAPKLPPSYRSLGDPGGKLLHTLRGTPTEGEGDEEYLLMFSPAAFRVRELMLASVAREIGRVALDQAGLTLAAEPDARALMEWDARAELAAMMLGMGVWVVNGAYVYENACCGGGCGIDLRSIRAGLSLPEASYALALDSQRKGIRRRQVLKHLAPTQKAATKRCWGHLGTSRPPALAAAQPDVLGALAG